RRYRPALCADRARCLLLPFDFVIQSTSHCKGRQALDYDRIITVAWMFNERYGFTNEHRVVYVVQSGGGVVGVLARRKQRQHRGVGIAASPLPRAATQSSNRNPPRRTRAAAVRRLRLRLRLPLDRTAR